MLSIDLVGRGLKLMYRHMPNSPLSRLLMIMTMSIKAPLRNRWFRWNDSQSAPSASSCDSPAFQRLRRGLTLVYISGTTLCCTLLATVVLTHPLSLFVSQS